MRWIQGYPFYLLLLLFTSNLGYAQQRSLESEIKGVEQHYGIHLIYMDRLVSHLMVQSTISPLRYSTLAEDLRGLLQPHDLEAIKISDKQWVIRRMQGGNPSAQKMLVSATVVDRESGLSLSGMIISNLRTQQTVLSNAQGRFSLSAAADDELIIHGVGYLSRTLLSSDIRGNSIALLPENIILAEVDVTPKSYPYPVGTSASVQFFEDPLLAAGRTSIQENLDYSLSNLQAGQNAVGNESTISNTISLNGLEADYMQILLHGKLRHHSSELNLSFSPGIGNAGFDLEGISTAMVHKITVLPVAAGIRYGGGAMAGILDFELDSSYRGITVKNYTGLSQRGDGFNNRASLRYGHSLGKEAGSFLDISLSYSRQAFINRAEPFRSMSDATDQSWVGQRVSVFGNSRSADFNFWINLQKHLKDDWLFYAFGGISARHIASNGIFRTATDSTSYSLYYPKGYLPQYENRVRDISGSIGFRKLFSNKLQVDLSSSLGENSIQSISEHTVNPSLGLNSPQAFDLGGSGNLQWSNEVNIKRTFDLLAHQFSVKGYELGGEISLLSYRLRAGQPESYPDSTRRDAGKINGANTHFGIADWNAVIASRAKEAAYGILNFQLGQLLDLSAGLRYEHLSGFKGAWAGSLVLKRQIWDALSAELSYNRLFKWPTLQQQYYSQEQLHFFPREGQNTAAQFLYLNAHASLAQDMDIPTLSYERANNIDLLIKYNAKNLFLSAKYSYTHTANKLMLAMVNADSLPALSAYKDVDYLAYFYHAGVSTTKVLQLMTQYNWSFNPYERWTFNANVTYASSRISMQNAAYANARIMKGLLEDSRPKIKIINSLAWQRGMLTGSLRATYFGSAVYRDISPLYDQHFGGKWVYDASVSLGHKQAWKWSIGVNNLLNRYPDRVKEQADLGTNLTFNGQLNYSREVSQFGIMGRYYWTSIRYAF